MDNIKLITLLKTLSKSEIEKFGQYLNTPLFNNRQMISRLFEEVKKFYPGFDQTDFTKENIFSMIYHGRHYNDELMRNMTSRLYKLLKGYLSFLNYEKDTFMQKYGLLLELNNRGHDRLFKKEMEKTLKQEVASEKINLNSFFISHRLAHLNRFHYDSIKHTHIIENDSLQEREKRLTEYFLADILHIYCLMINQTAIYPEKKYDMRMLKHIGEYMEEKGKYSRENFYINIYYNMFMMLSSGEKKYYNTLRLLINEHSSMLKEDDKSTFYTSMHNHIQEQIFKGDRNAVAEKLELYKESFANRGEYFSDGTLNHLSLIGAVNYCLIQKDFDEAESFLNRYVQDVEKYYRDSTFFYCRALIEYYNRNYGGVLKLLTKVKYDDITFKIQVKTLQLMAYFSIKEPESFYSFVDSFRHFLVNNKQVSEYYKGLYTTFINFTARLFKGIEAGNKFDFYKFKTELDKTNNTAKKHWLLEITEEFINKTKNTP